MSERTPEQTVQAAQDWWSTSIIKMRPGIIEFSGYPIQELIGRVSFSQMIWLMLRGDLPTPDQARLLDTALMASVDHGPHAPSIAIARMAISCGVDLNTAMASATNVLGDSHGGAGQQCMELFAKVREAMATGAALEVAVDQALVWYTGTHGKIVAGFGHRFHPVDPRAGPLLAQVEAAAAAGVVEGVYPAIAREIEAALGRRKDKPIPMNIDGATAVIFAELGFAPPLGRGLFILSRSVGILAHAWEQSQTGVRNKGPMPKEIPFTYAGPDRRALDEKQS
ncbi:MAG: citryl-CoA lyase [Brevundimonas subvibrioides]|uniref:citrate synthase (unknown stereospecificity) n=1 Tax=Brevundimonas subvibrioides TaxID=74313 RepID=A0A258HLX2_9CAUL|nr:citryl-CoA lyase [Brevundimonas subvibrioides]OYX57866.1 MAG: citryl-CoA lyase [Brevundimonas subvibrioides]